MPDVPTTGGAYHVCRDGCDHSRPPGEPVDATRLDALDELAQAGFTVVQAATAYVDAPDGDPAAVDLYQELEVAVAEHRRAEARLIAGGAEW